MSQRLATPPRVKPCLEQEYTYRVSGLEVIAVSVHVLVVLLEQTAHLALREILLWH